MRTVVALLLASSGCAASCAPPIPIQNCSRLLSSSVFFVGEVLSITPTGRRTFFGGGFQDFDILSTRFRVMRAYLGTAKAAELDIESPWRLTIGSTHFVEAYRDGASISIPYSPCRRLPDPSGETLQQFLDRRTAKAKLPTSISFSVFGPATTSSAYSVTLSGPSRRRLTLASHEAKFTNLKPGHYRLTVAATPGYQPATAELDVLPGACAGTSVQLRGAGRLYGRLSTDGQSSQQPAQIHLEPTQSLGGPHPRLTAVTDAEGQYAIEAIPPGVYRVLMLGNITRLVTPCDTSSDQNPATQGLISISPGTEVARLDITIYPDRVSPASSGRRGAACGVARFQ